LVWGEPKKTREKAEKGAKAALFMRRGWEHGGEKRRVPRVQARELRSERFLCIKRVCTGAHEKPKSNRKPAKKMGWESRGKRGALTGRRALKKKPNGGRRSGGSERAAHVGCVDERESSVGTGT
jgi:hypothetical protein